MNTERLTISELKAIEALIEAGSSKLAAMALGISYRTVEAHILNARQKTGHRNTTLLVVDYVRQQERHGAFVKEILNEL
jgi:DNA-binding CsgD family transcriptional regulator